MSGLRRAIIRLAASTAEADLKSDLLRLVAAPAKGGLYLRPQNPRVTERWSALLGRILYDKYGSGVVNIPDVSLVDTDHGEEVFVDMYGVGISVKSHTTVLALLGVSFYDEKSGIEAVKTLQKDPRHPPLGLFRATKYRSTRVYPPMKEVPQGGSSYRIRGDKVQVSINPDRIYVSGSTYPIKDDLRSMGFRWDRDRKAWWLDARRYDRGVEQRLKAM